MRTILFALLLLTGYAHGQTPGDPAIFTKTSAVQDLKTYYNREPSTVWSYDPSEAFVLKPLTDFLLSGSVLDIANLGQGGATDGQVLTWDNTAGEWVPETIPASSTPTLAEVLAEDSVTGGSNIVVESGDAISFRGSTGNSVRLVTETLSSDKVQVLQDVSGYIATLGDIDYRLGLLGIEDLAGGPGAITGNALKHLRVNAAETGVEWATPPGAQSLGDVLAVGNTSGGSNIVMDPGQGVAFRAAAGVGATAITGPASTASVYTATLQAADGTIAYTSDIPSDATYITQTAHAGLSNEQPLSSLSTGIVKVTTGTGVLSTATAGDFPTLNQSTTGSAATLTTSRTFQTNLASTSAASFNGSANNSHGVTGILAGGNGGTGNAFFQVSGPAATLRTYTFPNENATVLTSSAAVTVAQGGTGRATSTTAYGLIAAGTTATGAQQTLATGTAGQLLQSGGASSLPSWLTLGSGVSTWLGTPSSANLRSALSDETGTGLAYFQGGDIGTPSAGNGSNLTSLNASNLSSGTVGTARLGTGTASSSTFLRGDGTWATPAGGGGGSLQDAVTTDGWLSSGFIELGGDGVGIKAHSLSLVDMGPSSLLMFGGDGGEDGRIRLAGPSGPLESYYTIRLPQKDGTVQLEPLTAFLSSNFTTTSGSLVNVTGVSASLGANSTYNYEIQCEWASSNNAGTILASVTTPSGATVTGYRKNGRADGTMNAGGINGDDSGNVSGTCVTNNTRLHVSIEGKVITGGTAGNLQFRVASNSGYTLTIYEGCSVSATKVK